MTQSRKHRGYRSQKVVADWFVSKGWLFAESAGAGRSGNDITGVPGLRIEVKARRGFNPLAWLRQVRAGAETWNHGVPFVVFRCDGQGEANVGEWGVLLRLDDMTELLKEAGYSPAEEEPLHEQPKGQHPADDDERTDDEPTALTDPLAEGELLIPPSPKVVHATNRTSKRTAPAVD